ncbi:GNAT family N-acetyltransferase [Kaarinaea lacus]
MKIDIANTEQLIRQCCPVMGELRPHLTEQECLTQIIRQMNSGYRLCCVTDNHAVVAVAGFRLGESLAWGKYLYVDDLVTSEGYRSKGYGGRLLAWLKEYAIDEGCQQFHLDSGLHRKEAHRFYEHNGMTLASYHFAEALDR